MASLADELDLDPAFDDLNLGNHGGVPLSSEEEEQGASTSTDDSPPQARDGRRARRRVSSNYDTDEAEQQGTSRAGLGEGFSLADELGGGGNEEPASVTVSSFTQELEDSSFNGREYSPTKSTFIDEETRARKDREHYLASSDALNESQQLTNSFLSKLKQTAAASNTADYGHSLPSAVSNTSLHALTAPLDDTSTLESRAGNIVKQMRDYSNIREDQIRELQECDRLLRRAFEEGGDWINALASVDDFEVETHKGAISEEDALAFISRSRNSKLDIMTDGKRSENGVYFANEIPMEGDEKSSLNSPALLARSALSTLIMNDQQSRHTQSTRDSTKETICQQLVALQYSTSDLVTSLGSIHEQSQVARASMNDAARRIKSIKTVLNNWNVEIEAAKKSQAFISSWELAESNNKPRDIREWTNNHMEKFKRILNDADIKARELLSPIHDAVLDQLAAQG